MGVFHQRVSNMGSSNQMRVNFLAIGFARARWLQECVLCFGCGQKSRGTSLSVVLPGSYEYYYYFCTENQ